MILLLLRGLVAAIVLGWLPGWALERAWLGVHAPMRGLERGITHSVISVLLSGWLGLILATFGVFRLWLLLILMLAFIMACLWRSQPRLPFKLPSSTVAFRRFLPHLPRFDIALALIALLFALLVARPFEVIRGGLDAGVYTLTGYAIAQTGSIVQHDPILAEIGSRAVAGDVNAQHVRNQLFVGGNPERNLATKLRTAGFGVLTQDVAQGRVVPQFYHLWPMWIAIFTAVGTPYTGLLATGVAATLSVFLLGLLGRTLVNGAVGIVGAAFLALSTPQVWFGRMPTSEALAQCLILAGLWGFAHFAGSTGRVQHWWGFVTGAAFGSLALTRIDSFWATGPMLAFLAYIAGTRRWQHGHTVLATTLGVLLFHTLLHTLFISRAYFFDTAYARLQDWAITAYATLPFLSPKLRSVYYTRNNSKLGDPLRLAAEIGVVLTGLLVGVALIRWSRPLLAVEQWIRRWQRPVLTVWIVVLGLGAGYAYVIRPHIITADVWQQPFTPQTSLRLQGYVGAPITPPAGFSNEKIAQAQANMVRFGWYVSPLGVLLGVWGSLRWWRRGLMPAGWLFLVMATVYTVFYVRLLYGQSDATYIYILRRYVPLVYPAWMLAMAYALWHKVPQSRSAVSGITSRINRFVPSLVHHALPTLLTALLLVFFLWTGRGVYQHVEYGGAFAQFAVLAERVRPQDIIIVRSANERDLADVPAAPLTYLYGRNALVWKGTNSQNYGAALAEQVRRWRDEGRAVYVLLGASSGDWQLPGWGLAAGQDWTWRYREYEQPRDHKPSQAGAEQQLTMRLYQVVPSADQITPPEITADETAYQLRGLYRAENTPEGRASWTGGDAVMRLPITTGSTLALDLGPGKRPQALDPAEVCVSVAPDELGATDPVWRSLGCVVVTAKRATFSWLLPVPPGALLIRLETPPWQPNRTVADPGESASSDERTLGVRFFAARRP